MPKIFLKPNSPEFAEDAKQAAQPGSRTCDMPDCLLCADYKAPKDRSLSEHYWFCLEHVQDYNKAWDFFDGMSGPDIEHFINTSTVWDRPTRRYDAAAGEALHQKAWQTYHFTDQAPPKDEQRQSFNNNPSRNTPEMEALAIMGLNPPVTLEAIKARYKILVKKHHPDHAGADRSEAATRESQDLLKKINMAFTVLRLAYQKFEDLPEL